MRKEMRHFLPTPEGGEGSAASLCKGVETPSPCTSLKETSSSAASSAIAASAQLGSQAARASGRMWLHRSHLAHNAGAVSLMRKAELAACQNCIPACACL